MLFWYSFVPPWTMQYRCFEWRNPKKIHTIDQTADDLLSEKSPNKKTHGWCTNNLRTHIILQARTTRTNYNDTTRSRTRIQRRNSIMAVILDNPDDIIATIHHHSEMILCNQCNKEWVKENKHLLEFLSFTQIQAKITGIHKKCDGCHATLLNLEF